jgi:hypothetical protein
MTSRDAAAVFGAAAFLLTSRVPKIPAADDDDSPAEKKNFGSTTTDAIFDVYPSNRHCYLPCVGLSVIFPVGLNKQ